MDLVNGYKLLDYAKKQNRVLPAFNTTNFELTQGIIRAFKESNTGGYIAISSNNLTLSNPDIIAKMVRNEMRDAEVPVALHLDHGKSFEDVKACIDAGFTSIIIDMSHLPFEENIKEVKRAVEYCHYFDIPVEAELGAIQGKEDDHVSEDESKTNPEEVQEFIERTNCDLIAVSIGNVHGLELTPELDIELLADISEKVSIPIVLHGGSGIPFNQVRKARELGVLKVNYGADVRKAFIGTFGRAYMEDQNAFDVMGLSRDAIINVKNKAINIIEEINK